MAQILPVSYQNQLGWLLERTLAFLDEQPPLFRYLHLHEEFLLEIGPKLGDDSPGAFENKSA